MWLLFTSSSKKCRWSPAGRKCLSDRWAPCRPRHCELVSVSFFSSFCKHVCVWSCPATVGPLQSSSPPSSCSWRHSWCRGPSSRPPRVPSVWSCWSVTSSTSWQWGHRRYRSRLSSHSPVWSSPGSRPRTSRCQWTSSWKQFPSRTGQSPWYLPAGFCFTDAATVLRSVQLRLKRTHLKMSPIVAPYPPTSVRIMNLSHHNVITAPDGVLAEF